MKIGGLEPFTLSDFPGCAAAVVFAQGCNFRCPFCHNGTLIPSAVGEENLIPEDRVLDFLRSRRGRLEGVVVSGGEPTIQPDLAEFLRKVKGMGFATKLDTNGSRPDVVGHLIRERLVDYVAMDVKGPLYAYDRLAGTPTAANRILESIRLIAGSGVKHEFRTTVVKPLLDAEDLRETRALVPESSPYRLQAFRPENALDPALRIYRYVPEAAEPSGANVSIRRAAPNRSAETPWEGRADFDVP